MSERDRALGLITQVEVRLCAVLGEYRASEAAVDAERAADRLRPWDHTGAEPLEHIYHRLESLTARLDRTAGPDREADDREPCT